MNKDRRNRIRFDFWLDVRKDDELLLTSVINELKAAKGFVSTIRQGLMLVYQLQHRDTTLLFELFPWLTQQTTLSESARGGHSELAKEIVAQIVLMSDMTEYLKQAAAVPTQPTTGKLLCDKAPAPPVFHDDPDEPSVLIRASTSTDSSMNFVTALRSMQ